MHMHHKHHSDDTRYMLPRATRSCGATAHTINSRTLAGIQRGLGLSEEDYDVFKAKIERELEAMGWVGRTFHTSVEKATILPETRRLILDRPEFCERFPETMRKLKEKEGSQAFRYLIYKICSNYRRRTRKGPTNDSMCPSDADSNETEEKDVNTASRQAPVPPVLPTHPSSSTPARDQWQAVVSLKYGDGPQDYEIVARLCDLAQKSETGRSAGHSYVDTLDYNSMLRAAARGNRFRRNQDKLAWERQDDKDSTPRIITIHDERQWRAVLSDMLRRNCHLEFRVVTDEARTVGNADEQLLRIMDDQD